MKPGRPTTRVVAADACGTKAVSAQLETAQKLSDQLRAAENRVGELEAQVTAYQERAERAEQWLHRVYTEIEDRFFPQREAHRAMSGAPQRPQNARWSR